MNARDTKIYIERYNRRLEQFGNDPRTLGWNAERKRQFHRFKALLDIAKFLDAKKLKTILDIGCGFADLYGYMKREAIRLRYRGVDFNQALLNVARKIHPEVDVACQDILLEGPVECADLVLEAGIFNAKLSHEDQWTYIESMLRRMFELANYAVAADFMSSYVEWEGEGAFHISPEKVFSMAQKITPRIILRHDYFPYEFCIYILK